MTAADPTFARTRPRLRVGTRALPYLLSLPALLVCIGILIPFGTAVYYSLQRYRLSQPWAREMNWGRNYLDFLGDAAFWNTLQISLTYATLTVVIELLLGLGIALLLQRRSRVNNLVSIMLLLPLMTAPALASLMWKLMTNANFGVLSWFAGVLGFPDMRWASSPQTALFTVILVDVWVYTPFMMILLLAGLRSLPQQPFEAAAL
ncbi:MAG: carbohydrate ABC transporter permease, partial [Rubrimonas sp.]